MQSDPIGLEGGENSFVYVGGNPLVRVDKLGLWASKFGFTVHQEANERIIGQYEDRYWIDILNEATDIVDGTVKGWYYNPILYEWEYSGDNQASYNSYKHAMRGYKKGLKTVESVASARNKANRWVRALYQMAWDAEDRGDWESAYLYFGRALHTLQDETSPAHTGWQIWKGEDESGISIEK